MYIKCVIASIYKWRSCQFYRLMQFIDTVSALTGRLHKCSNWTVVIYKHMLQ